MADIGALGNLGSSEPLDLDTYKDVDTSGFKLPKRGRYTLRAPDHFPDEAFGKTAKGLPSVQIDPTIVGPTGAGYTLKFTKVSAKRYDRGGEKVSQLGDYLRSHGVRGQIEGEAVPWEDAPKRTDAVRSTAGRVYEADVDWRAWDKVTRSALEGMKSFPSDGNGGYVSYVTMRDTDRNVESAVARINAGDTTEREGDRRVWANLQIDRFIPQS